MKKRKPKTKAAKAAQEKWLKGTWKMLAQAMECSRTTSNKTISCATEKPAGVSDVRWRMELRRRADPDYYARCENP